LNIRDKIKKISWILNFRVHFRSFVEIKKIEMHSESSEKFFFNFQKFRNFGYSRNCEKPIKADVIETLIVIPEFSAKNAWLIFHT